MSLAVGDRRHDLALRCKRRSTWRVAVAGRIEIGRAHASGSLRPNWKDIHVDAAFRPQDRGSDHARSRRLSYGGQRRSRRWSLRAH